jgi:hypothetical protein
MTAAEIRQTWEAAYRATEYRVQLPRGELILRIGMHLPEQDRRLRDEAGVQTGWAIVTACNPQSRQLLPEDNAKLRAQLTAIVASLGLRAIGSSNHDPSGAWPDEPGLLLCDPRPGRAEKLGRHFRQNAIVAARLGHAPQLVWLID